MLIGRKEHTTECVIRKMEAKGKGNVPIEHLLLLLCPDALILEEEVQERRLW
jgi:hypothetical protein